MTRRPIVIAFAAALALAGCSKKAGDATSAATGAPHGPIAAVPAPAGKSWTDIVSATPEGGMRMGNPDAPVKIVEYASFTCPHCKLFETEGAEPLQQKYISTGKVSWEFRSFLIHGPDAPVTLLMNCRGAEPFFALSQQLYAAQDEWLGKIVAMTPAEQQQMQALPPVAQFKLMADKSGLFGWLAARGLPRAQAEACLSDQKAIDALTATQDRYANQDNVNSTPTFVINGERQENVATWPQLDAKLAQTAG
ncbi:thioredoxin domain-containing protein [Sphingomonas nostoxanthinifaciens]|uniref:thioredoxin domain-containing protein n=1 Tax=Sphingomonas nostoxanthinifaciens TaxID=2872652 RepID=UPI001CC1C72C|nr:thioredoxin domain-containing protein [Sphingomonas nostoxanthinifaciens]UAK26171.1 DsbA family protein [Sphingomonas nostoxanthinifaciens]